MGTPGSTRSTPSIEANVVWPPPDEEVERVIGIGRAQGPGEPSLVGTSPAGQPQPTATPPDATTNPVTADAGGPGEPSEGEEKDAEGLPVEPFPSEQPESPVSIVALKAVSPPKARRLEIERHFSLTAAEKPTISVPVAFGALGKRPTRAVGLLGIAAVVAILIFTVPTGRDVATLVVRSEPAGAMVTLNGVGQGQTPYEVELVPGEYVVELRRGDRTWRTPVDLRAGVEVVSYFALGDMTTSTTASQSSRVGPVPGSQARAHRPGDVGAGSTGSTPVRATAPETPAAARVAEGRRKGWLVVSPAYRVTLLADGELLDLVAAGERRRFALTPGDHELELLYESGARETRRLRIAAGSVARLDIDSPDRAAISTEDQAAITSGPASDLPRPRVQSLPPLNAAPFPVPVNARAIVELQIDEYGRVASATLQRSINSFYDERLLSALQNWRYEPAQRDGRAVASTDVVEIAPGPSQWFIRR